MKILDFGLARREEDGAAHLTQAGAIVGTPAYMAPEQATGEKLDGRADLFSLGVLLYRLATGTPAFTGPTTVAMLMQVATHEPPAASAVKPGVPVEMARIIAKLMAKKKEDRYGSAKEFLADWERLTPGRAEGRKAPVPEPEPATEAGTRGLTPLGSPKHRKLWPTLVLAVLVIAVAAWFLIPRGTNGPVVVKKEDDPPPVIPVAKEPPPLDETNAKEVQSAWAAKLKVPIEETSPTGIVMVLIPPGALVDRPYRLGKYEVTQGEWQSVMGYNPSGSTKAANCPVENVSWYDSVEYCNKLSEREGLPSAYELTVKLRKGPSIEEAEVKILGGPGYPDTDGRGMGARLPCGNEGQVLLRGQRRGVGGVCVVSQ